MRNGNKYIHYKGNNYFFKGIALSMYDTNITIDTFQKMIKIGTAKYHENTHDLELYSIDGALFINSVDPYVIYQSEKDLLTSKVWAREVDDFFGYTEVDGKMTKRFTISWG